MLSLFKNRNFSFYWISHFISVVGDHVTFLAFPWLVLQMTGSVAMTGLVLAAQGIPRAIFMLWGGALVDRTSPRATIMVTNLVRMVLMAILTYAIIQNTATLTIIFSVALIFGLADAFYYPASNAIIPSILKKGTRQKGNAIIQMTTHLSIIFGPVIAGFLIAGEINTHSAGHTPDISGLSDYEQDRSGLARAFMFDAFSFALSCVALLLVKTRSLKTETQERASTSMWEEVKEAIHFCWSIPAMRLTFISITILEFFYQAPIFVGLPALAKARFAEGAFVYGLEIAAYGLGAFLGSIAGGIVKPHHPRKMILYMLLLFAWSSATLGLIVIWEPYEWAMLLFFTAGAGDSYIWVHVITWVQEVTPERLLGRVMSIFMFMSVGLLPVGNMIMGFLFEWNLEVALIGASIFMTIACLLLTLHPDRKVITPQE